MLCFFLKILCFFSLNSAISYNTWKIMKRSQSCNSVRYSKFKTQYVMNTRFEVWRQCVQQLLKKREMSFIPQLSLFFAKCLKFSVNQSPFKDGIALTFERRLICPSVIYLAERISLLVYPHLNTKYWALSSNCTIRALRWEFIRAKSFQKDERNHAIEQV